MSTDLWASIEKILDGYKAELCDLEQSVELLKSLFERQTSDGRHQFFDLLQSKLLSEPYSRPKDGRTVHEPIMRAWAAFGLADRLPSAVFALMRFDDREGMESWAQKIAPDFLFALWTNRARFSRAGLDAIRAQCAIFTHEQSAALTNTQFPRSLVEAASRLEKTVDKISFDRFARTLQDEPTSARVGESPRQLSIAELKLQMLRIIGQSSPRAVHKYNLLGRPSARGELELALDTTLGPSERNLAYEAFDDLRKTGHITPTYSDLVNPELWVVITELGQKALRTGALDDLDDVLLKIAPHLLELRRGAWAALNSGNPHSLAQAAHSTRELIDQTLKIGAPDDEVKMQPWYSPDSSSRSGVTRRMRLKLLMAKYTDQDSETDLSLAEKAAEYVAAVDTKVIALAHARVEPRLDEVKGAISSAEIALGSVLTSFRQTRRSAEQELG
jgi:Predicted pPIWI-associating nuclease